MTREAKPFSIDGALGPYLLGGAQQLLRSLTRLSAFHPREAAFLTGFAVSVSRAAAKRAEAEARGERAVPMLIARVDAEEGGGEMPAEDWARAFAQAQELGVSFVILIGDPLKRPDVLARAAETSGMLFAVFTEAAALDGAMQERFDASRNLLPVLREAGGGVQADAADALRRRRIPFAAWAKVTGDNAKELTSAAYLTGLREAGCRVLLCVEAPGADAGSAFSEGVEALRRRDPDGREMLLLAFPGDEAHTGGCLAAGRGFAMIAADGSVTPCPYWRASDASLRTASLREALASPLFAGLRGGDTCAGERLGCAPYRQPGGKG